MPGMGGGGAGSAYLTHAFHAALVRQGLLLVGLCLVAFIAWNWVRLASATRVRSDGAPPAPAAAPVTACAPEPAPRRALRLAFAALWCLDGLLQLQSGMVLGLPSQVMQPAASGSPKWVTDLVGTASTIWARHPVAAATSAVWIQLGIGLLLLVAPRGRWSRFAGATSVGWGLLVWGFGEAFGGIFAPGLSILFGAPGAALLYVVAGALIALPDRAWSGRRLGRTLLALTSAFLLVMAILQAWPGRGFWQGGTNGAMPSMVGQMAQTPQPAALSSLLSGFASVLHRHAAAANLVVVVGLVVAAVLLMARAPARVRVGLTLLGVFCVADWVLVQDLGFLGGIGTDPNSMLPLLFLAGGGYLAVARPAEEPAPAPRATVAPGVPSRSWPWVALPSGRSVVAACALGAVVVGAAPMAAASVETTPTTLLAVASSGAPEVTDGPAPNFSLEDQRGQRVTLSQFRGDTVVLTFLDPTCTSDCPLIGSELRDANAMLGPANRHVRFVAIAANPLMHSVPLLNAYDREVGLQSLRDWYYLTGPKKTLAAVLDEYGVEALVQPGGAMIAHSDIIYIIDRDGVTRRAIPADPGPNSYYHRSFAAMLTSQVEQVARS